MKEDHGRGKGTTTEDVDRAAILAELAEMWGVERREAAPQPNFTVGELAEVMDVAPEVAWRRVRQMVRDGALECMWVRDQKKRRQKVFWKRNDGGRGNGEGESRV